MDDGRISLSRGVEFFPACHERRMSECKAWNFRIDLVGRFGAATLYRPRGAKLLGDIELRSQTPIDGDATERGGLGRRTSLEPTVGSDGPYG